MNYQARTQQSNLSKISPPRVSGVLQRQCACGSHTVAGDDCESCSRKKEAPQLQRTATNDEPANKVPPIVNEVLHSSGQPLNLGTRTFMESHFGHDFSHVRVHTDAKAAESAKSVNALAYTVGHNMVFGAGQYVPETAAGRNLLAHELTHTIQQTGAAFNSASLVIGTPHNESENEADKVAQAISNELQGSTVQNHTPISLQRRTIPGEDDPIHKPIIDKFRRQHGLPLSGVDESGNPVGPSAAKIKYGEPATAFVLAEELQKLIDGAVWKEIRKRVYPKESAAGIQRARDRNAGKSPDLTGLGQLKTLNHFATEMRNIQSKWSVLSSPDNRVKELGKAANVELKSANIPGFLAFGKEPMQFKAFFDPRLWRFVISQEMVSEASLTETDAAEMANTTLHECRHAEQSFLAARFSAGVNKKDSAAIVAEQHIPKAIADEAVSKKFDASTDAAVADLGKRMFEATVTDGTKNQAISNDDGLAEMAIKRKEAQTALNNLRAVPVKKTIAEATAKRDALQAEILIVEQKYTQYRNIPYEADAHEVGDAAEEAFKGWK